MPYQKLPLSLRPLYLKGLPKSKLLKQAAHLDLISNYENSAYKLNNVKKLELVFKQKNSNGHQGIRQFWKFNLKTINFHNPNIAIEVQRIDCITKDEQLACPCVLKVHLADGTVQDLNCKNKFNADIMKELITSTEAQKIQESEIPLMTPKFKKN